MPRVIRAPSSMPPSCHPESSLCDREEKSISAREKIKEKGEWEQQHNHDECKLSQSSGSNADLVKRDLITEPTATCRSESAFSAKIAPIPNSVRAALYWNETRI